MVNVLNRISSITEFNKKISDYENHIRMMIGKKGQPMPLHVIIVSGDKGVGKTFRAKAILEKQNIRRFDIKDGDISPVELYKELWDFNDGIIVLDDVNSILQDSKAGASLLKACTDSYGVRKLNWSKQNPDCIHVSKFGAKIKSNKDIKEMMDEIVAKGSKRLQTAHENNLTFPDMFFFTGAIVILTNKPLEVIDKYTEGALSNRGYHLEMLFNVEGALALIKEIAPQMKDFNDIPLSAKSVTKAVKFLNTPEHIKLYKNPKNNLLPTLRTLGKLALECECGNKLDDDTLINNIEAPAY